MRHETCLNCLHPDPKDQNVYTMIFMGEAVGGYTHHHHLMHCGGCGAWWFDDMALINGQLTPLRRDTAFCDCDEGLKQYTPSAAILMQPDAECHCTKAFIESQPHIDVNKPPAPGERRGPRAGHSSPEQVT